jgi:hypothetical protein
LNPLTHRCYVLGTIWDHQMWGTGLTFHPMVLKSTCLSTLWLWLT